MKNKPRSGISRRSFIKWSSAATAMVALPISRGLQAAASDGPAQGAAASTKEGVWKPAACWHNCGGRCLNKALVVDGVVERQKTDDTHPDSPDYPQQRGCLRGRSQRKQVFGADRLRYPMKRKNWAPGGGDKSLRGRDQWVRISWDEALDIVASETKRIKETYGNESIWLTGSNGNHYLNLYANYGGYTSDWGTTSWGAWKDTPGYIGVHDGWIKFGINDRFDLRKSQLIVLWGANPAWSSPGNPTYHYLQAKKAGARFISIDPSYNATCELLDAEWVPINPGTDHALALGIMYALLEEDDPQTNPLIDWDFLDRCCVGFDREHMPAGANPDDNFQDYLLGTFNHQPRTPEWAAEICGVPPERIRSLAREIGGTHRAALLTGWAPARIHNGEGWVHAFSTLGFMTGHMGRPGRMTGVSCHYAAGNGGPRLVNGGATGLPTFANPVKSTINHNEINRALTAGAFRQRGDGEKHIDIRMMFHTFNATMQTRANIHQGIAALREKVEFIVSPAYVLHTSAKYADVVLPVTTEWEREGTILNPSNRDVLIVATNIVPPLYEAKSDQWIAREIGKRLGIDVDKIFPISEKQQFFNMLQGATVIAEDGKTPVQLLTITAQDIAAWGVEGRAQQGRISLGDFLEKGCYQVARRDRDNYGYIAYEEFVGDPAAHPRETDSGKFEIYCPKLTRVSQEYGWSDIPALPAYTVKPKGYEESFADWERKEKGKYPFQVYNPHYLRRSHSTLDNVPWLREAWPSPVYLNKSDAVRLGIKHGETVLLSSATGKTLRPAWLTETMKPGVVGLPHGGWFELDEKNGIDLAGADNAITEQIPTGFGTSGWNTVLCNVEKWQGPALTADAAWPQRIFFSEDQ
ncbi:molybdopterin-dependent oxidoreductase [Brenneria tiliae]|uniref:Molybdopterin-dependent oxidoreductase n=1 Tax=Brenneria tiliae TaxID=2914984 RepID=A0ABT0N0Q0_9GAMM|nr:molybdopterin-dependent oxidoreductase [Brenneria tiliae]MCL2895673.1 molybdopterin-dependent oxidoreductase [Brenneria tiliae]